MGGSLSRTGVPGVAEGLDKLSESQAYLRMLVLKQPTIDKVKVQNEKLMLMEESSNHNSNIVRGK